jgi:cytochrome P450
MATANSADSPFTGFVDDPHRALAEMRSVAPIHRIAMPDGHPAWLVTGYAEARAAAADGRLVHGLAPVTPPELLAPDIAAGLHHSMMHSDPPDHTRLRGLVSRVFTAGRIKALRPRIVEITESLIDSVADRAEFDLVAEVALAQPLQVICELLGLPLDDRDAIRAWTVAYTSAFASPEYPAAALTEYVEYLRDLIEFRRRVPDDGLICAMLAAQDGDDRLTDDEVVSTACLLLAAGYETTSTLISSGMYHLLTHPGLADELRADPAAGLPAVIEELLRYEGPVATAFPRVAREPLHIGDTQIAAGELVLVSLLSANRDAAAFTAAEAFDPQRAAGRHLAFGHGIHYCLGAPLARVEGEIAFTALLTRLPTLRLAVKPDELRWLPSITLRSLVALPVTTR